MSVAVFVERASQAEATVKTDLVAKHTAILNDQGFEHVHKLGSNIYYPANYKKWNGASFDFLDIEAKDLTAQGDVFTSQFYSHLGDTDTRFEMLDDEVRSSAGGTEFWRIAETTQDIMTFNNASVDVDYQFNTVANSPGLFIEGSSGIVGIGTLAPLQDVGTSAGDFSGTGFHVKASGVVRAIIEGNAAVFTMADTGAVANDKLMSMVLNSGVLTFLSSNDDTTDRVDDILVMDMGTGNVGFGVIPTPSIRMVVANAGDQLELEYDVSNNSIFSVDSGGLLRIGASGGKVSITDTSLFPFTPAALLHLEAGTEQFRIGFTSTKYVAQTVDTNNQLTFLFNTATENAEFILEHATANDTKGVVLNLFKNDTGTAGAKQSEIRFSYDDSAGNPTIFSQIRGTENVRTNGSEEGGFIFEAQNGAGALGNMFEIDGVKMGFYAHSTTAQQTGVAVTAAAVHAALVALGLITA